MIDTFQQSEDLESVDDLHQLCSLMQTIRTWLAVFLNELAGSDVS
jgi:hypothetical protein